MPSRGRGRARAVSVAVVATLVLLLVSGAPTARASAYPVLPLGSDRWFVSNLTGAELTPGSSGSISFSLGNPIPGATLSAVVLTLGVYAFNAFPGNATSTVGVAAPPVLVTPTGSGPTANLSFAALRPNATLTGSVGVQTSATTPSGTFAVRLALRFTAAGETYLLESRGWFTSAQWALATAGPNGSVDLNVSALGVSGVIPETSVLVSSSNLSVALYAILGAGVVLVGLAGWLYFRPPKSRAGVRNDPGETQAPSALGSRRTKDGD